MRKPQTHGRMAEFAYEAIRRRILNNEWPDGSRLRETDLAESLGVSRTPVREALRRLTADGLVESVPNVGSRMHVWSAVDLEEIFGLRSILEGYAARLAALRLTKAELAEMNNLCMEMEHAASVTNQDRSQRELLATLNDRFHSLILQGSRNGRLVQIAHQVVSIPLVLRTFIRYEPAEISRSMAQHREMLDAFQARDPEWAESIMRAHLQAGLAAMRRNQ